jgi:methyl-accepting chemotaxis protein
MASVMQDIIVGTEEVAAIVNEIATATAEQAAGIEQVNHAITQLEGVTRQNAAQIKQAAAAAGLLREQVQSLTILVSRFKIDPQKMRTAGHHSTQSSAVRTLTLKRLRN